MKTPPPRFWAQMAGIAGCLCAIFLQADTVNVLTLRNLLAKAENKDAEAQYQLGYRFDKGIGAPRNAAEAIRWYRASARLGHKEAQFALGSLYTSGSGVKRDYPQAYMWLNIAASSGHSKSSNRRDILALWMGSEDIALAEELSLQFFIDQFNLQKDFPAPAPVIPVPLTPKIPVPPTPTKPTTPAPPTPATPESEPSPDQP